MHKSQSELPLFSVQGISAPGRGHALRAFQSMCHTNAKISEIRLISVIRIEIGRAREM